MSATKLDALLMAIRMEKQALDREMAENKERLDTLREESPLYAFTYGELTVQKRFREMLERWET